MTIDEEEIRSKKIEELMEDITILMEKYDNDLKCQDILISMLSIPMSTAYFVIKDKNEADNFIEQIRKLALIGSKFIKFKEKK